LSRSLALFLAALSGAGLIACSTDICHFDLRSKYGSCDAGTVAPPCPAYAGVCEGALSQNCSANDVAVLNRRLSCLQSLPNCVAGQETTWGQRVLQCDIPDSGTVSLGCAGALTGAFVDAGCSL